MRKKLFLLSILLVLVSGMASASLSGPSSVEVDSGNSFFENYDGEVIVMEFTDDSFDSSTIRVSPEDVNGKLEGRITEDLEIKKETSTSKARYSLEKSGYTDVRPLDYNKKKWEWGFALTKPSKEDRVASYNEWANSNGEDLDGDGGFPLAVYEEKPSWSVNFFGYTSAVKFSNNKKANIGDVKFQKEEMSTTFCVMNDCRAIGNTEETGKSATFSNTVKINWKGGLESGYDFPDPDNSLIAYSNRWDNNLPYSSAENGWRVISENRYSSWKNHVEGAEDLSTLQALAEGDYTLNDLESTSITKSENAVEPYSESDLKDYQYSFEGDGFSDGTMIVEADRRNSYSTFQVIVKADEVGYFIPEATPTIESTNSPVSVKEGRISSVEATVGNEGTGEADFTGYMSCSDGFSSPRDSMNVESIEPGETDTISFDVSFQSTNMESAEIQGSCDVRVENNRDNSETVSSTVTINGQQETECTKDGRFPAFDEEGNYVIKQCGSEGLQEEVVEECGPDEVAEKNDDGVLTCIAEEEVNPDDGNTGPGEVVDPDDGDGSDGSTTCLIDNSLFSAICVEESLLNKLKFIILLTGSLLGGGAGYMAGSYINGEQQIQGRNRYLKSRSVSRMQRSKSSSISGAEIGGALVGVLIGAGVGLYLGVFGTLALIGLMLLLKYLIPGY